MTELKPGTPEYDEAYKKEMDRLEAEAGKKTAKADDKPDSNTPDAKADDKSVKADEGETAAEIKARLEKAESALQAAQKAIKDTQRWGHRNAEEVARLKKEAEERKRNETRPKILDDNPGLEDAIKHVSQPASKAPSEEDAKAAWLDTVARAIPDVETLLGDDAFRAKAAQKKSELGGEWDDPISAIRELSALRTEHLSQRNVTAAVEAARKDFEVKSKKRNAMEVPGGSGGKDAPTQGDDAVKRYQTMTKEEFAKERSRVMGY